jgi:hypothetical protein
VASSRIHCSKAENAPRLEVHWLDLGKLDQVSRSLLFPELAAQNGDCRGVSGGSVYTRACLSNYQARLLKLFDGLHDRHPRDPKSSDQIGFTRELCSFSVLARKQTRLRALDNPAEQWGPRTAGAVRIAPGPNQPLHRIHHRFRPFISITMQDSTIISVYTTFLDLSVFL